MKEKMNINYMITMIVALTVFCIILGVIFDKTEAEKVNGLAETYDVNAEGDIAYVSFDQGKPGVYIRSGDHDKLAIELSEEESISDLAFSPDGKTLTYIVNKDGNASLYAMTVRSFETEKLFQDEAYITEIVYDPENESHLFYLRADTFENYSPIAKAHPHEYDLYSYDRKTDEPTQHTDLSAYDMHGLDIDENGEKAYMTMVDDNSIDTEGDSFSTGQRIFRVPLDNPEEMRPLDLPVGDTHDVVVLPDESGFIYKAVAGEDEQGTFQYELFHYDASTDETEQITNVQSYAGTPTLAKDGHSIYFIVNNAFARKHPQNSLHKVNIDGTKETHIPLEYE